MATVNFYLSNKSNNKGLSQILLYFSNAGKRIPIGTPQLVDSKKWDRENQKAIGLKDVNQKLNRWKGLVLEMHEDAVKFQRDLSVEATKQRIKDILYPELKTQREREEERVKTSKRKTLYSFIAEYIQLCTGSKSVSTIKHYKTTFKYLQEFDRIINAGRQTDFDDITLMFYQQFVKFCQSHRVDVAGRGKGTVKEKKSANTVGSHVKNLKVFLGEAFENDFTKNNTFQKKGFKVIKVETDSIYLNESKLEILRKLDLSGTPYLDNARDLFLLSAYSGLRFSDVSRLNSSNIKGDLIEIQTQKTSQEVIIPIFPEVQQILDKNNGSFPRAISNQKLNDYLKLIAKKADFNDLITVNKVIDGKKVVEQYPEHQLIATHTGRRSFATNMYYRGFPIIMIMRITGHKSESSFFKYIKVGLKENAERIKQLYADSVRAEMKAVS